MRPSELTAGVGEIAGSGAGAAAFRNLF